MPRNLITISTFQKLPEKTPENQVTRQDPRYRGPEEVKDAKRTYSIQACSAKMDWPCDIERKREKLCLKTCVSGARSCFSFSKRLTRFGKNVRSFDIS